MAKDLLQVVKFDKSTQYMDPKEETYWLHFLSRDRLVGDYIRSQIRHNPQLRKEILRQPVCQRCEGFTFFAKGGSMCPACGTFTPENQTHSVKTHMREGYHR